MSDQLEHAANGLHALLSWAESHKKVTFTATDQARLRLLLESEARLREALESVPHTGGGPHGRNGTFGCGGCWAMGKLAALGRLP